MLKMRFKQYPESQPPHTEKPVNTLVINLIALLQWKADMPNIAYVCISLPPLHAAHHCAPSAWLAAARFLLPPPLPPNAPFAPSSPSSSAASRRQRGQRQTKL